MPKLQDLLSSAVVEHTTCKHKIKGSNPAIGTGREKMAIMDEMYVRKVVPIDI
jgi:hypothetical protein